MSKPKDIYKLHVVERGRGRPVILLHGALSSHRYWNSVADRLNDRRKLYMPDLLGFGGSPKPHRADYSLNQFIECLEHTFEEREFKEKPILAGHSMGANVALRWALNRPEKFAAVILSSPLLFEKSQFHQQMASLPLEGKWLASKGLAKIITFTIGLAGWMPTKAAVRFSPGKPRHVMEDVTSQKYYVFRKVLKNVYYRDDVLKEIKQLKLPTHMLIGSGDWIANHAIDELKKICSKRKTCHMHVLEGSHQILLEHPETVAKVILSV